MPTTPQSNSQVRRLSTFDSGLKKVRDPQVHDADHASPRSTNSRIKRLSTFETGLKRVKDLPVHDAARASPWTKEEQSRIVESFPFDELAFADYMFKHDAWDHICCMCPFPCNLFTNIFTLLASPCLCYYAKRNAEDFSHRRHLALSEDGIMYCEEAHKSGCRCNWQDVKEMKLNIPYEKMTNVRVIEPTGGCVIKETLHRVVVSMARDGEDKSPEFTIWALPHPEKFAEKLRQRISRHQYRRKYGSFSDTPPVKQMSMV